MEKKKNIKSPASGTTQAMMDKAIKTSPVIGAIPPKKMSKSQVQARKRTRLSNAANKLFSNYSK